MIWNAFAVFGIVCLILIAGALAFAYFASNPANDYESRKPILPEPDPAHIVGDGARPLEGSNISYVSPLQKECM